MNKEPDDKDKLLKQLIEQELRINKMREEELIRNRQIREVSVKVGRLLLITYLTISYIMFIIWDAMHAFQLVPGFIKITTLIVYIFIYFVFFITRGDR